MMQYKGVYYATINGKRESFGTDMHSAIVLFIMTKKAV
jgi:hypothetical protein